MPLLSTVYVRQLPSLSVLFGACLPAFAVTVSNVKVLNIGHSDALIGFNFSTNWRTYRIRWTTGATNCSSAPTGAGVHVTQAPNTNGSNLTSGGNYYQAIVTGLPPSTLIHVCPELSETLNVDGEGRPTGTDTWSSGAQVDFTTQSRPAQHPALPQFNGLTPPSTPPDMTGACVWVVGTGATTHCTGETTPDCSTFMACWNAAMDQQLAHKTIVQIPAGTTITHRNYVNSLAPDAVTFTSANFTTNGMAISNSYAEGQGLQFGTNYGVYPGPGNSGEDSCDGIAPSRLYYVHFPSGPSTSAFQLTCDKPYSQGGQLLKNRNTGSGNFRMAPYPRALNWIMVTTTTSQEQLPPPGTRTSPAYAAKMAKLQPDSISNGNITQDGTANIGPYAVKFDSFDGGGGNGLDMMVANQWWTGLEISAASYGNDTTNGNPWTNGLIIFGQANSNIVFDRNWIHGLPWPERMNRAIEWVGINTAFINNYMENFVYGRKMVDNCSGNGAGEATSDSPNMIRSPVGLNLVFYNNYLEGNGIPIHFDGGGPFGPTFPSTEWNGGRYYLIQRNTFKLQRKYVRAEGSSDNPTGDPYWEGRAYSYRQPLEFKGGQYIKIDGNIFDTALRHTSVSTITMTSVVRNGITDVDITNNTLKHVYGGITLVSTGDGTLNTRPFDRVRVANNLVTDLNGDYWVNHVDGFTCPAFVTYGGYFLNGLRDGEDATIDGNTVTDAKGLQPGFLSAKDKGQEGTVITNNFLDMTSENGSQGVLVDGGFPYNGYPDCHPLYTMSGTT